MRALSMIGSRPSASSSSRRRRNYNPHDGSSSFLTRYFLIILLLFGCMLISLNRRFMDMVVQDATSMVEVHLKSSFSSLLHHTSSDRSSTSTADAGQLPRKQAAIDHSTSTGNPHEHRSAGLNCDKWGGPSNDLAQEMVYWEDIPSDASVVSPFHKPEMPQYMTFEPDQGGWNNIRMAMESMLVRILVRILSFDRQMER
jgi:hypothetical protein